MTEFYWQIYLFISFNLNLYNTFSQNSIIVFTIKVTKKHYTVTFIRLTAYVSSAMFPFYSIVQIAIKWVWNDIQNIPFTATQFILFFQYVLLLWNVKKVRYRELERRFDIEWKWGDSQEEK